MLPVHDSFITYHERQSEIRDEMVRAYKEKMQSEIGIDADPSFIEQWNKDMALGVDFDAQDVIENAQANQGYDGFRERHREFFKIRTEDWWHRFG